MRKTKTQRLKEEKILMIQRWCLANGWTDKAPNGPRQDLTRYKVPITKEKVYRIKFNPTKIRYEVRRMSGGSWTGLASAAYKDLFIDPAHNLAGLTSLFGPLKPHQGIIIGGHPIEESS
jgi:hypothetical protein